MRNELVETAKSLGGDITPFIGSIFFRRWLDDEHTKYCVVALHIQYLNQAREITEMVTKWGWEGFTDVINLKVEKLSEDQQPQPPGPDDCPIHGTPLKPSQKQGWLYCPKKNADGSFCKYTTTARPGTLA